MATTFSFAHFSDPHLPLPAGTPRPLVQLAGKRLLGYLSWHARRVRRHLPAALAALCADVARYKPEHLLVTGDLVNIALPGEFTAARRWLESLGPPAEVTVTPGNHDASVTVAWPQGLGLWAPWMAGDGHGEGDIGETRFPVVRRRGPVAFVALSSAVPTAPLLASGRLGAAQIERTAAALAELGHAGLFRVLAIHHPPLPGVVAARKGLDDHAAFAAMLAASGAELVVHGHCHHSHFAQIRGPAGQVPVVGVPSASAPRDSRGRHARWHLFHVARDAGGWRLSLTVRGLQPGGGFASEGGWSLRLPAAG